MGISVLQVDCIRHYGSVNISKRLNNSCRDCIDSVGLFLLVIGLDVMRECCGIYNEYHEYYYYTTANDNTQDETREKSCKSYQAKMGVFTGGLQS